MSKQGEKITVFKKEYLFHRDRCIIYAYGEEFEGETPLEAFAKYRSFCEARNYRMATEYEVV